mmetsp:Transcript_19061/g.21231  ORF Transcript_19061/g.21231 Transcript_19061/m.21231 type:complete len:100 (+) Transcript_19061:116-415(+)
MGNSKPTGYTITVRTGTWQTTCCSKKFVGVVNTYDVPKNGTVRDFLVQLDVTEDYMRRQPLPDGFNPDWTNADFQTVTQAGMQKKMLFTFLHHRGDTAV